MKVIKTISHTSLYFDIKIYKKMNDYLKKKHFLEIILSRDNYSKSTWGLASLRFAYLWFKTYHFAYLYFNPLPPPPRRYPPDL